MYWNSMKISQVRANYYFEFLRIIVIYMLPILYTALAKYDSHVNYYYHADFSAKIINNN